MNNYWMIAVLVVVALIIALSLIVRYERSKKLRRHFGPEYEDAVARYGGNADSALRAREKRVNALEIRPLSSADRRRFADQWHEIQTRFVDDPKLSITRADELVCEIMSTRGYPMTEFEARAEDLSVNYPLVVRNYRAAHAIASQSNPNTEDLRRALVHYRSLCDELLETRIMEPVPSERTIKL